MMTCRTPTPSQPVEALVDFRKLQAMGQELVDRQASGAQERDHAGHVALRRGRRKNP
jgi:hypothetical protein